MIRAIFWLALVGIVLVLVLALAAPQLPDTNPLARAGIEIGNVMRAWWGMPIGP